jgi:hypothetical protein
MLVGLSSTRWLNVRRGIAQPADLCEHLPQGCVGYLSREFSFVQSDKDRSGSGDGEGGQ